MNAQLNYTNKAGEVVTAEYEPLKVGMYGYGTHLKSIIRMIRINGIYIKRAVYVTSESERQIKATIAGIRKNNIHKIK